MSKKDPFELRKDHREQVLAKEIIDLRSMILDLQGQIDELKKEIAGLEKPEGPTPKYDFADFQRDRECPRYMCIDEAVFVFLNACERTSWPETLDIWLWRKPSAVNSYEQLYQPMLVDINEWRKKHPTLDDAINWLMS